ncbi:tetratricopeptide repeat protein [Mucilaginibacter myungsuensis]|uniref:Tetratricopeptide repeat protein n=1 Tax=Mucilaginibacter myungsuensis TaxID=649104 RepID=A0A929KT38_9SPHI|nr:tetratricopeptide repeat protein [Mucilaginibacter myungsuensis]MBE9661044.1 tetratricopeptide repeat protein [Mucilaginibacter myungsuensis]MDN3597188.1 tetratricopeptide repeat protein [Mucilaginibacter myungsuensis]
MKTLHNLLIAGLLMVMPAANALAQSADAEAIIKQGIQLHDKGDYAAAIEKYQEALKLDPKSTLAEFEIGYSMLMAGRGKEAIPHLEAVITAGGDMRAGAYDMLGSVYDNEKQFDKAFEQYKKAIEADPKYQRAYFNMGIAYVRQEKYAEAESYAISALKLNPRHSSSHKLYGFAAAGQKKKAGAVLAYCNFLLLEPQSRNTAIVYNELQKALNGNISAKDSANKKNVNISLPQTGNVEADAANLGVAMAALSSKLDDKKNLPAVEQLQDQLKTIFLISGELAEKKANKDFFEKFYAGYFYSLASSPAMAAFTKLISLTGFQQDNIAWFKANPDELKKLEEWDKSTAHAF